MIKRKNPLIPPKLFRSRNVTVSNISTLVIYGALYVTFFNLGLFVQGTLGYDAAAAGIMGVPGTLFLVLFSTRFGRLAARYGPRLFMALGPAIMALGVLWYTLVPASSQAWQFGTGEGASILPPSDYLVNFLPGLVLFGIGLMIMVAPLTTAVMTSVPEHNSGVASAINNAISRVGPQLAGALIFVAIASSFYSSLGQQVPGLDTSNEQVRTAIAPLNQPDPDEQVPVNGQPVDADSLADEADVASTQAFHLAMIIGAGLLVAGAAVNAIGIRNPSKERLQAAAGGGDVTAAPEDSTPGEPAATGAGSSTGDGAGAAPP